MFWASSSTFTVAVRISPSETEDSELARLTSNEVASVSGSSVNSKVTHLLALSSAPSGNVACAGFAVWKLKPSPTGPIVCRC